MKRCSACGENTVESQEHYTETLEVCTQCGNSVPEQKFRPPGEDGFHGLSSHGRRWARTRCETSTPTANRRDLQRILKTSVSKLGISGSSSISDQAHSLSRRVSLVGHRFRLDCVAAACLFSALRVHDRRVTLQEVAEKVGLCRPRDVADANRVVKHLKKLQIDVRGHSQSNLRQLVQTTLRDCEFWTADGSRVDNESMVDRAHDLLRLLGRIPRSSPHLLSPSAETAAAAAFLCYKAERLAPTAAAVAVRRRAHVTARAFLKECSVGASLKVEKVASGASALTRALKLLVAELPYMRAEEVRKMSSEKVLHHLEEVFKYENSLVFEVQRQDAGLSQVSSDPDEIDAGDAGDAGDVDEYIRTPEEVEAIRPLHEKIYGKIEQPEKDSCS